jgi:hypothetical protein
MAGTFDLHPRQMEAMRLIWEEEVSQLFFGGAAGGGKSELIRALAYTCAMKWPGAHIPIFRLTLPELQETHIEPWLMKMAEFGYDNSKCWQASLFQYRFPNGSIVEFRHIDQKLGALKWLSAEWAALLVDEATLFNPRDLRLLYSRVRRPKEGRALLWTDWRPLAVYAANPGGPAHAYFKQTFIDEHRKTGKPWTVKLKVADQEYTVKRAFLQSMLVDNPSIDPAEYVFSLADLPETERQRMLEGNWDYFEGKVFPMLAEAIHLIDSAWVFKTVPPQDWPRIAGLDHGTTSPTAAEWITRDEDGFYICGYLEYYSPGQNSQHIRGINALTALDGRRDITFEADPQMYRKRQGHAQLWSVADEFALGGDPASQERNEGTGLHLRMSRAERMASRMTLQRLFECDDDLVFPDWHPLRGRHGAPGAFICKQAGNLWREINNLKFENGGEETVKADDHSYDALYRGLTKMDEAVSKARRPSNVRTIGYTSAQPKFRSGPERFPDARRGRQLGGSRVVRQFG